MYREHFFSINLSADDVEEAIYRRQLHHVIVSSEQGVRIKLPLQRLIPFVTKNGIQGRFCLRTGFDDRFISLFKTG